MSYVNVYRTPQGIIKIEVSDAVRRSRRVLLLHEGVVHDVVEQLQRFDPQRVNYKGARAMQTDRFHVYKDERGIVSVEVRNSLSREKDIVFLHESEVILLIQKLQLHLPGLVAQEQAPNKVRAGDIMERISRAKAELYEAEKEWEKFLEKFLSQLEQAKIYTDEFIAAVQAIKTNREQ